MDVFAVRNKWLRWSIAALLFIGATATIPRWWCGLDGERWLANDQKLQVALAREVAAILTRGVTAKEFTSDSSLFRHEWQFGTYQMGALGLIQVCAQNPDVRAEFLPVIESAIDHLLSQEVRAFDAKKWGEDPLDSLSSPNGHAAYLGYTNLVLSAYRQLNPTSRFNEINDRISSALARRLRESRAGILETYPSEAYPVDNAALLASLIVHSKTTRTPNADVIASSLRHFQSTWRDPKTGLIYQMIDNLDGSSRDRARGSGTALATYFLSLAEHETARSLFHSLRSELAKSFLGFGAMREYANGETGTGDIDSGPVVFGMSPSGSGFSLAACRVFDDRGLFVQLYRTAHLLGAPLSRDDRHQFVTGGPLGNAIMLAMLTAPTTSP